jgi:glycosyltransferase involved in cell wall biosynthesis
MFEYLAAGRPILASGLPVLQEVLNGENAILLEPDDVDGWVAALRRVVEDPALAERLASQARRDAQRFSWRRRAAFCLAGLEGERQARTV